jgi:hypothetical protein
MESDEKIELVEHMSKHLSNIKEKLGRDEKYSPDIEKVLDVYENADWKSDERITDKLLRIITDLAVRGDTGKLPLKNFNISNARYRKSKKSAKSKRKAKCKCK